MSIEAPETEEVTKTRISCDGGGGALGHPLVWLTIGPDGYVECPYCDKKFILKSGASDH
ncbi:MAG: zinc-finger domain-containing protein [Pseudomonadota bacterium]